VLFFSKTGKILISWGRSAITLSGAVQRNWLLPDHVTKAHCFCEGAEDPCGLLGKTSPISSCRFCSQRPNRERPIWRGIPASTWICGTDNPRTSDGTHKYLSPVAACIHAHSPVWSRSARCRTRTEPGALGVARTYETQTRCPPWTCSSQQQETQLHGRK